MSEEEKKAFKVLEEAKDRLVKPKMLKDVKYTNEDFANAIDIILKLISKYKEKTEIQRVTINLLKKTGIENSDLYIGKDKIKEIRDKAEVMDYYSLNDVIDDLSKLIGDYKEDE